MTNFATFIDSANAKAPIAQRGHAKQKRTDLRFIGVGLVVTRDGAIPLVSHTYAANRPDVRRPKARRILTDHDTTAADQDKRSRHPHQPGKSGKSR